MLYGGDKATQRRDLGKAKAHLDEPGERWNMARVKQFDPRAFPDDDEVVVQDMLHGLGVNVSVPAA